MPVLPCLSIVSCPPAAAVSVDLIWDWWDQKTLQNKVMLHTYKDISRQVNVVTSKEVESEIPLFGLSLVHPYE